MATQLIEQIGAFANATLAGSTTLSSALKAATIPNDIYQGQDWDALTWPEQLWAQWYIKIGDPVLATGIMSFVLHEVFYFGRCVPWMIIDAIPYFKKYKIQEDKAPTPEQQWKCTKYVLMSHFTIELPQIVGFEPLAEYFGMATHQVPFPSWKTMLPQIALFFLIEDTWHYWAHRAMHYGPLYKKIHKLHHEFSAPFGLAAEYAHPIEILVLGMGTVGGPLLWCWLSGGNCHIITMYLWIILRLFQAVDAHSGYDFPWSLNNFLPFWAGADHHDEHHRSFIGCYSSSFRHWDWLFGTDAGYHAHRAKQAEEKKAAKEALKLKKEGFKTQ